MKIPIELIGVIVISSIFGAFVFGGIAQSKAINDQNLKGYQECKSKTADLEWCFKQFNPHL